MANRAVRSAWIVAALITCLGVTASCSRDKRRGDGGGPVGNSSVASTAKRDGARAPTPSAESPAPTARESTDAPPPESSAGTETTRTWGTGELHDIGPAGPASATSRGLVMVSKHNELIILPLDKKEHFLELEADSSSFAKYGRGPAVTERFAYWIDLQGQLWQAALKEPTKHTPLHRARPGTRVSAVERDGRELVAFIAEIDDAPTSLLWSSTGEVLRLNPEGSTASSVRLVLLKRATLAFSLAGRTGMSPVHGRVIRVAPRRVSLGEEQVVWVGPGAQPLTELEALASADNSALLFLASARNITEFGLAHFAVGEDLTPVDDVSWNLYPNGIDPAPVAVTRACGKTYVFYAQPSTAQPRSPQELRVALVQGDRLEHPEVIARGRAINDISVAARPGGVTLAWTADRHTWAQALHCPPSSSRQ